MAPSFPLSDQTNIAFVHTIFSGHGAMASWISANSKNFFSGKLGASLSFSANSPTASLRNHVRHIVGVRTKKKVIDINARPNIAFMADVHSFGDFAVYADPCKAMGSARLIMPIKATITNVTDSSNPQNAAIFILWRRMIRKRLSKCPVTRAAKTFRIGVSHNGTSNAVVGQGPDRRVNATGPAHNSTAQL